MLSYAVELVCSWVIPWISKLGDLLEYLVLPSWPETCVFSARSQILERDMQEADPDVLLMLPGCQVRFRKHYQISHCRHSSCPQGEERTLSDLLLMPEFLSHVGSPQQWPHTVRIWTTQITDSHPHTATTSHRLNLSTHIREVLAANEIDSIVTVLEYLTHTRISVGSAILLDLPSSFQVF